MSQSSKSKCDNCSKILSPTRLKCTGNFSLKVGFPDWCNHRRTISYLWFGMMVTIKERQKGIRLKREYVSDIKVTVPNKRNQSKNGSEGMQKHRQDRNQMVTFVRLCNEREIDAVVKEEKEYRRKIRKRRWKLAIENGKNKMKYTIK